MITLLGTEWERLWAKRWTWLLILVVPGLAYLSADYFESFQSSTELLSDTFVLAGLRNNLYFPVNIILAALVATVFTEEYRGGQLRYVFLRHYTRRQIFISKMLLIYILIFLMLVWFSVSLYILGYIMFSHSESLRIPSIEIVAYTIKYYAWAFLSLVGITSLFSFFAMYSKNVTYAMGIGMLYILTSLLIDGLFVRIAASFDSVPILQLSITYMMIPFLQHTGLDEIITDRSNAAIAVVIVITIHFVVFTWSAYRRFVKTDYLY
ncbi:ABC transporter permease [Paenibacillus sp. ACRSA]|uniref:ABC transporter permease n=1 Tax=Paenibacillus sp. ACRSA TaxID=2918211 RepID=UPI001EF590AA|nr:ABC transporter permease [Paenibacillus sp. ACRSA]MCG7376552.1 ABC transporter permease [Paenibacillus sp. ACRSA]